jgi:hypothetical protein
LPWLSLGAQLRRYAGAHTNRELSTLVDLYTYILMEMQRRWGGNPFDNRDTIYSGFEDDETVNDRVKRHVADPRAAELAVRYYTPTGRLAAPMLAIRTVCDHVVPAHGSNRYAEGPGHCAIRPEEVRAACAELRGWRNTGVRRHPEH